jgi:hypothetical protein
MTGERAFAALAPMVGNVLTIESETVRVLAIKGVTLVCPRLC